LRQRRRSFHFSATAPASPKAPTVGALDRCSRRDSTSSIRGVVPPASVQVVLTLLTYMTHRDVGNADIAGADICPSRQSLHSSGEIETYKIALINNNN